MFGLVNIASGIINFHQDRVEREQDQLMLEKLPPEAYKEWKAEKVAEKRHKELISAIRSVKNETIIKRYYY